MLHRVSGEWILSSRVVAAAPRPRWDPEGLCKWWRWKVGMAFALLRKVNCPCRVSAIIRRVSIRWFSLNVREPETNWPTWLRTDCKRYIVTRTVLNGDREFCYCNEIAYSRWNLLLECSKRILLAKFHFKNINLLPKIKLFAVMLCFMFGSHFLSSGFIS